ncbi:hypothetical protein Goshw_029055 [Gossypium schwendimanii]|uniref:Uncharacterized protein n=1 Tax=Gossypium schwendimanii TaxID=34291 RepID=A0A7J9LIT4_GOSSC|nr:hypothetical protein [Gossypium schwendimanii]
MAKQTSQVCGALFIVLSLLANYSISTKPSEQHAPSPDSPTFFAVPPSANIPDVETKSNETISQENVSTLSNADEPTDLQTKGEETLSDQQPASSQSINVDPTLETNGDNNIPTSLSPPIVDNSVLDTRVMDSVSQENTSVPLLKADPPAAETKESGIIEDLFQENTSLPPSPNVDVPNVETNEEKNTLVPSSPYIDTPAFETSDDGSFTQENLSPPPSNTVSEYPEDVPQLNDYSSLPNNIVPAPSEALSYPESDTFSSAPTSNQHTILPFNYRAEDEPVEPYEEEEEDSWNGVNGAVAGVLVGVFVIGVGGFVYKKRKNDNVRAQYHSLAKKEGV